jgi:hypothetical protein
LDRLDLLADIKNIDVYMQFSVAKVEIHANLGPMATPFGTCPQCASRMRIERLVCWRCGTSVSGQIAIPLLATLPEEHARFVERFLVANGSLTQLQKEMECSYPKVRRLMNETMAALREEFEAAAREKDEILRALEDERLGGKEAAHLLRNLIGSEGDGTHGS